MLIEFSEFNLKLLLFIIYPIFIRIQDFSKDAYIKNGKDNELFITFRHFLSFIFSGIFLLIFKIRTRKIEQKQRATDFSTINENNEDDNNIDKNIDYCIDNDIKIKPLSPLDIVSNKIKRKKAINIIICLFLLSILGIVCIYYGYFFKKDDYVLARHSVRTFFGITNYTFLSYFILKQKLYRHHFISYGCIIIILIILFILSFPHLKEIWASILFYFLYEIFFGLYDVCIKKYMNVFYETPYFIMFCLGIITLFLLIIYDTITYFVNPSISGIIIGFKDNINNVRDFFLFFLDLIIEYIWNLSIWLLFYYFTPCHYFISEYIDAYIYYILNFVKRNNNFYSTINCIIFSVCFLLNIFFILIFNEIIILNFCNLDYNTSKRIKEREKHEYDKTFQNKNKDLNELDSYGGTTSSSNSINQD